MTLSLNTVFCSVRFLWAASLALVLATGVDGFGAVPRATKPKITVQPVKQTVTLGASVTLSVTAISSSPLSYQWRLNKTAIPGANSETYSINPVMADSAGRYDVVVTNTGGAVTSRQVMLTVDMAPRSLPVGTALYDEVTIRLRGQSVVGTGGWMVSSPTALTDPEDNTGVYTFAYGRISVNRAILMVSGSFYDADLGERIAETVTYALVFTGVSSNGELECRSSGSGVLIAPEGYRPAKIPVTFSGTTSISMPP